MEIILDLDGVLADFVGRCFELFGRKRPSPWPSGVGDVAEVLGVTRAELWRRIDEVDDFWESLKPTIYFDSVIKTVTKYDPEFIIATSPSMNPNCATGKIKWLQNQFGSGFRRWAVTPLKWHLATARNALIDDYDRNCDEFSNRGGTAILFCQPWNSGFSESHRRVSNLQRMLELAAMKIDG